jgi:microcystin degradation protein MlrC
VGDPLRVAYGRISLESNALSPLRTTLQDFERTHLLDSEALARAVEPDAVEAPGFLKNAELSGFMRAVRSSAAAVETIPLFSAWTVPGGPLCPEAFAALRDRLVKGLREAGRLDGVFLALHGALCVPGVADPEGEILTAVRAVVPGARIAVTFDLHANLTPLKVQGADILCAYRTNPHRDHARVGERAGRLLLSALAGRVRPVMAWRSLPLVLGGGNNVDFLQPMRAIYRWMRRQERDPKVLYVNLFQNQLWLDHAEVGWSTCIVTDDDVGLADRLAEELADLCWSIREQQPPVFPDADSAIAEIRRLRWARRLGTVCVCDASDVVGAGGTGDNTRLLRALLETAADLRSYVPVRDPSAVERLWGVPVGRRVDVAIGGTMDPRRNAPVDVRGTVMRLHQSDVFGRMAVVRVDRTEIVVTEGANLVMRPRFYRQVGLDPWKADIVVVKSLFPFRLFFAPMNRRTFYVRTEGITDFDAALREIAWENPVYPRDSVEEWRSTDLRRRGLMAS